MVYRPQRLAEQLERTVALGDDIEVRVEDIDPNGKISLRPTSDGEPAGGDSGGRRERSSGGRSHDAEASPKSDNGGGSQSADREVASFEDSFDAELAAELGDLGPAPKPSRGGRGRGRR